MSKVGVHEAKTHLSRLLRQVAEGEEVIITSGGRPAARLVPIAPSAVRDVGFDRAILHVPEGFDDPLEPDVIDAYEG